MGYSFRLRNAKGLRCRAGFLFLSLAGHVILPGCNTQPGTPVAPPIREVAVMTVSTQPVSLATELPGRIAPMRIAEIRPQASGLLLRRHFQEGADVRSGQLLYEIDPRPFLAAVEQARASLGTAERNAERARAAIVASQANVERQKATLELARQNRQRVEASFQERAVSASQRDEGHPSLVRDLLGHERHLVQVAVDGHARRVGGSLLLAEQAAEPVVADRAGVP